jgi:hypothetical protein
MSSFSANVFFFLQLQRTGTFASKKEKGKTAFKTAYNRASEIR